MGMAGATLFEVLVKAGLKAGEDFSMLPNDKLMMGQKAIEYLIDRGVFSYDDFPQHAFPLRSNAAIRMRVAQSLGIDVLGELPSVLDEWQKTMERQDLEESLVTLDWLLMMGVEFDLFAAMLADSRFTPTTKHFIEGAIDSEREPNEALGDKYLPIAMQAILQAAKVPDRRPCGDGTIDTSDFGARVLKELVDCETKEL